MKIINDETRKLLDKLYNLRGKDSVVLFGIEEEYKTAQATKEKALKEKTELENSINKLASDEKILADQGERLKNILKSINPEDFAVLIKRLDLDFDPEAISMKINNSLPTISPIDVENVPETFELTDEIKKEEVKNLLKVCGFNINDFTSQDITNILNNYDPELISKNVEYINSLGINRGIFVDNIDFLYDKELKQKIDMLLNIGKDPMDIYLNPNVLIKYNLTELYNAITALKDSGLEPDKVPLMAF